MENAINTSALAENSAVLAAPLIKDGAVYLGACDTYFYALDIHSGRMRWSYKSGGPITGAAIMYKDVLYFGSFDNYIYALSREGALLWKLKTGGIIAGSPAISGDVLYIGSCDNNLYAISLDTQKVLWKFLAGDEIISDPLIDEDRIYVGSQDGYFYCLDLNGNLDWKFKTGGSILVGSGAVAGGLVFFGSSDQNFYAVDKEDGSFKWGFRTGDMLFNNSAVLDNIVLAGSRDRYLYALDQKTGKLAWKFRGNDEVDWKPALYKDLIIFSSDKIYAIDKKGMPVWSYPMPVYLIATSISADSGVVVAGSYTGYVYGFSAKDGQNIWKFKTNSSAPPLASRMIAPPKWDAEFFKKHEPELPDVTQKPKKKFEPYTFTTLDESFFEEDKKEYAIGERKRTIYEESMNPPLYSEKAALENKKRKKELDEWMKKMNI